MAKNLYINVHSDGEYYISDGDVNYLWQNFTVHSHTGFSLTESVRDEYGEAPGYYPTKEIAQAYLDEYNKRNNLGEKKMSQNYAMIEGEKVELSEETVKNLKTALGIKDEPKQVKVHCFRASRMENVGYPYYLGGVASPQTNVEPKLSYCDKDKHVACYSRSEVEQIIAGLQELLAS
jgi:hypothetical protein